PNGMLIGRRGSFCRCLPCLRGEGRCPPSRITCVPQPSAAAGFLGASRERLQVLSPTASSALATTSIFPVSPWWALPGENGVSSFFACPPSQEGLVLRPWDANSDRSLLAWSTMP